MTTMVAITGNTYPVKDQLRAMGGSWIAASKAWMVPADKADAARSIVPAYTAYKPTYTNRSLSSNKRNCPSVNKPCYKCGTYCYGDCEAS